MAQEPCYYKSRGDSVDYTPGGDVTAGDVIVQGTLVGVAKLDIAANVKGALSTRGVFDVPKDSSNLSSAGTALYWDADGDPVDGSAGTGAFTSTATGNTFAGWNLETAGAGAGTVRMFLDSSFAISMTTLAALSDVGALAYAAGSLLVGDGDSYEEVALSGAHELASSGALNIASATVAAAGNNQATAAAVAEGFTLVTGADATKGVKLPAAAAGKMCIIKNEDSANAVLPVYPNTDDAINALSANVSLDMAAKTSVMLMAYDATTWYSVPLLPS